MRRSAIQGDQSSDRKSYTASALARPSARRRFSQAKLTFRIGAGVPQFSHIQPAPAASEPWASTVCGMGNNALRSGGWRLGSSSPARRSASKHRSRRSRSFLARPSAAARFGATPRMESLKVSSS